MGCPTDIIKILVLGQPGGAVYQPAARFRVFASPEQGCLDFGGSGLRPAGV